MKNQLKNMKRIPDKLYEKLLKTVGLFNHSWYMRMYVPFLKKRGMDIKPGEEGPIYIAVNASFDGKDYSKIHIGKDVVISGDVRILTHDYSISRALQSIGEDMTVEAYLLKDVYIGDNTFIGARSIILPGAKIGKNVIVGAGSVVRGRVEDDSVVIGNPAVMYLKTSDFARKHLEKKDFFFNKR